MGLCISATIFLVSIHAPVRGATAGDTWHNHGPRVSIHAPVRGATPGIPRQPCLRRVSIHAPVRGATILLIFLWRVIRCFNPRPCARGDKILLTYSARVLRFNPRPCARGDPPPPGIMIPHICFNPRPCARGDIDYSVTLDKQ